MLQKSLSKKLLTSVLSVYFLLTFVVNCLSFSLELLFFFYFKSPSDLKTASQNRPNTYASPSILQLEKYRFTFQNIPMALESRW